ncbi:hypothetical protein MKQ68_02260 [Chitinophaga horti]|uniref:Uncharacterized protein n=1 Tax=Chitinophaga horti TaxID=2920382 RepID=A0ABY6J2M7_9BACT|nr:hypothetical protein [Chitinophaga horti]UYQ93918.1 hypothetical protein MKQ68_02260 [Chitinophaga horti]
MNTTVKAQVANPPVLPNFQALIKTGKIQLDFISGFRGVSTIGVQRSLDSVLNFNTIGYIADPNGFRGSYVDNKPLPGKNYYRMLITFSNGRFMYTKTMLAVEDSTINAGAKLSATDIQAMTNKTGKPAEKEAVIPWKPSNYIYTTADGNINIKLPEAPKKKYVVKFYEATGAPLFEIEQVAEPFLIIEKAIFLHAGWFNFEIFEEGKLLEKWNFYIPLNYRS